MDTVCNNESKTPAAGSVSRLGTVMIAAMHFSSCPFHNHLLIMDPHR